MKLTNDNWHCPRCNRYLDLHYLCIGKGEYGEYLSEEFDCPQCGEHLTANTERTDVITLEMEA